MSVSAYEVVASSARVLYDGLAEGVQKVGSSGEGCSQATKQTDAMG
jgi:hypothetical protein